MSPHSDLLYSRRSHTSPAIFFRSSPLTEILAQANTLAKIRPRLGSVRFFYTRIIRKMFRLNLYQSHDLSFDSVDRAIHLSNNPTQPGSKRVATPVEIWIDFFLISNITMSYPEKPGHYGFSLTSSTVLFYDLTAWLKLSVFLGALTGPSQHVHLIERS